MTNEIKEIIDYLKDDKWDYYPSDGIPYKVLLMEERDKLLDCITNLEECCKDKIDRYQDMILKYCKLQEKYKKSCETYQQALDETMSEKMDLEKENEDLREDNYAYHQLMKMQNKREFRSKFLKEFQEEFGTNTFPDYDEIYKRYDKIKKENERLSKEVTKYDEILCERNNEVDRLNKECNTYMKIATKRGNIIDELEKLISIKIIREANEEDYHIDINDMVEIKTKLIALKEGKE